MANNPATRIQDLWSFGEYGGVNPSVTDSSTYTFLNPETMEALFDDEVEGCFLYSRHWNPINKYLSNALATMEDAEAAHVTASGMSAISSVLLQLCRKGEEIVCSRTIYGGTYALLKNFLPRLDIHTRFVDITDLAAVEGAIGEQTRVLYCESISNPLLEIADIQALSKIARKHNLALVVDNTFSPLIISPIQEGADVVVHSLTKFINGTSDCVAGAICGRAEFISSLMDINEGASMLLGPVLDSNRAASILKNLNSLHIRMKQHSQNAAYLAEKFRAYGITTHYPGLDNHPQHELMARMMDQEIGYGGMLAIDMKNTGAANRLMAEMQRKKVGYLAVSLGYFKTLFSSPGHSTSSEIPESEREIMGLSDGLVRFSTGLDSDIKETWNRIEQSLQYVTSDVNQKVNS